MFSIKKFLNRRKQQKVLNRIRQDLAQKAKTKTAAIDEITFENRGLFMVCPSCFSISKTLRPGYAVQREMCSCCGSEGMEIDLIPVTKYLQKDSLDTLQERLAMIADQDGLREEWKHFMCVGLKKLIELKKHEIKTSIQEEKK